MSIRHEHLQKARRISRALQEFMEMTNQTQLRSTEVYPYLVRQGLVERDKGQGIKFRQFLHKLRREHLLHLIPQCKCVPGSNGYHEWYFYKIPSYREDEQGVLVADAAGAEAAPAEEQEPTVRKLYTPALSEAEIDALIAKGRPFVAALPREEQRQFTPVELETRRFFPRAYERWSAQEERLLARAFERFGRVDKVAELLERQPSAVRVRLGV